ncbi:MAG: hypothetical protein QUS12_05015 [Methanosarcina sp.]|jgi:hypothetical protein|nr:hypothetical protein [Methanosarcina sp.]
MFFKEAKREIHKTLIRDREENVRFNEMIIESYQKMEKLYRTYPTRAEQEKAEEYRKMIREWKNNLEVARRRLNQTKREYDEMYREERSLPLIQSGILEET